MNKSLMHFSWIILFLLAVSCNKDTDLLDMVLEPVAEEEGPEEEVTYDEENSIEIPVDFDWSNIPDSYKDYKAWIIKHDFDLAGKSIALPENIILAFEGGKLSNATLSGDDNYIVSNTYSRILESITLSGTYATKYLKPYWFGAVMDGTTDDRTAFVETLAHAQEIDAKVLVDRNMFLDVEEMAKKSIYLEDNSWIEGANGAQIILNNLLSPAFYIALTKDVTIKNVTFLWDQQYDASYGWDIDMHNENKWALKDYMSEKHNVTFNPGNPITRSPIAWRAIFSLEAPQNVTFSGVTFKAKGETPDKFIIWAIKLKEQFAPSQTIISDVGTTEIPRNIVLENVTMDGVLMGVQGIVDGFTSTGMKSYRYSDVQDANGGNIGGGEGNIGWMPPPHLFYLNPDSSTKHNPGNIVINNTYDYGEYVGSTDVRNDGYCHSLKLVEGVNNVSVKDYSSYRRDGLGDIGDINGGYFENLHSEYDSSVHDPTNLFNSLRFLGTLNNTTFKDVTIIDTAERSEIYPLDFTYGDNVTWENINVYVNEIVNTPLGFFGIFGSNNTILNSSLTINKHLDTSSTYKGVVFHTDDTRENGSNNHYEVTVNGWRSIEPNPIALSTRMIFASSSNTHSNYAKIMDTSNNYTVEQINETKTDTWTRSEELSLGSYGSQPLTLKIPAGYALHEISIATLEALAPGVEITVGTSETEKDGLIGRISSGVGEVTETLTDLTPETTDQTIYLYGNTGFQNTGKIKVTLEFQRKTVGS